MQIINSNNGSGAIGPAGADGENGIGVTGANLDGSYHLHILTSDNADIDVGNVRGGTGPAGSTGPGFTGAYISSDNLHLIDSSGGDIDLGNVRGPTGAPGATGPNAVTTSTATNLDGILYGNGGVVGATGATQNGIVRMAGGNVPTVDTNATLDGSGNINCAGLVAVNNVGGSTVQGTTGSFGSLNVAGGSALTVDSSGNMATTGTVTGATVSSTGDLAASNHLVVGGNASVGGVVDFTGLAGTDPGVAGRLWNDGGTLKVSAG